MDHVALVGTLGAFDGWVLATSSDASCDVENMLRDAGHDYRRAVWVRNTRNVPTAAPQRGYEVVLFRPSRKRAGKGWPVDTLVVGTAARRSHPDNVIGAKPAAWWSWVFRLLAACPGDELVDVYPGSGLGSRAWAVYAAPGHHPVSGRRRRG